MHAFILQCHIIAFLQSRQYWNKAVPTSFQGRRFVIFYDACAASSVWIWLNEHVTTHSNISKLNLVAREIMHSLPQIFSLC